jgi:hypothetical protein
VSTAFTHSFYCVLPLLVALLLLAPSLKQAALVQHAPLQQGRSAVEAIESSDQQQQQQLQQQQQQQSPQQIARELLLQAMTHCVGSVPADSSVTDAYFARTTQVSCCCYTITQNTSKI